MVTFAMQIFNGVSMIMVDVEWGSEVGELPILHYG
jgi:hypothetical protein